MRFLLDQSTHARLQLFLQQQGHEVTRIGADYPEGLPDSQVLAIAQREGRVLVTNDRDFGELVFVRQQPHAGVVFVRLSSTRLSAYIGRMTDVLAQHSTQLDAFLVVTDHDIRVRR